MTSANKFDLVPSQNHVKLIRHIRGEVLHKWAHHKNQHGNQPGKSILVALQNLTVWIIKSLENKEVQVQCFLDKEGHLKTPSSIALKKGADEKIYKWIRAVLKIRLVKTNLNRKKSQQHLLYLMNYSDQKKMGLKSKVIYANDVAILVKGKFQDTIFDRLQGLDHSDLDHRSQMMQTLLFKRQS